LKVNPVCRARYTAMPRGRNDTMDTFTILFQLAVLNDPAFMGGDPTSTILTMEANRLQWDHVPEPRGDKVSFATGYIMGREGMPRDAATPEEGENPDYELGYDRGVRVRDGLSPRPDWDRESVLN